VRGWVQRRFWDKGADDQDDLIDNTLSRDAQLVALDTVRKHLYAAFSPDAAPANLDHILDELPNLPPASRSAFYIFSALIPRLCPMEPFLELCQGYETDLRFSPGAFQESRAEGVDKGSLSRPDSGMGGGRADEPVSVRIAKASGSKAKADTNFALENHLPIRTQADLMQYADDVAGSIASAICYLSWSILDSHVPSAHLSRRPVDQLGWTKALHQTPVARIPDVKERSQGGESASSAGGAIGVKEAVIIAQRTRTVRAARTMGRALQLVNIARDVAKDAAIGRLYIPLSKFDSARDLLAVLQYTPTTMTNANDGTTITPTAHMTPTSTPTPSPNPPDYSKYNLPLLDLADEMRIQSAAAIDDLPPTARGGTRAMVASYFQIADAVRRERGKVDERGVRVSKVSRVMAAAWAMWVG
jgi:15-cis-phytoene synthase/lycopene beta-cyclase